MKPNPDEMPPDDRDWWQQLDVDNKEQDKLTLKLLEDLERDFRKTVGGGQIQEEKDGYD